MYCKSLKIITIVSAILLGAAANAQARHEFCGAAPAAGFDQPPNMPHLGRYVNKSYGYEVTIPRGLTAFSAAVGPERGIGIVLSWTPRAFLSVDASYDVFYDITAAGVHRRDLNAITLHDSVLNDARSAVKLDGMAAERYQTRAQCGGDPTVYVHESVIVVRDREIYRLNLQSLPERLQADDALLSAMLKSWKWQRAAQ